MPLINNPLVPAATAPGGGSFTLTVNGTGFVSGSVVNWNGLALATNFVSGSQLTATVPASNVATASTASVTVVSPTPGGGTSNVDFFDVRQSFLAVSFGQASSSAGGVPASLVAADLNGDGKLDLATLDGSQTGSLAVLLGNGDGTFQPPVMYSVGFLPFGLLAADFNGDGHLDIALTAFSNDGSEMVSVMLGNGDGAFQTPIDTGLGSGLSVAGMASGDFNGDGRSDVAVSEGLDVLVLLGNGDGTFQLPVPYPAGSSGPLGIVTADFNSDGRLDLVVSAPGDPGIVILFGNGDGTFQSAVEYQVPYGLTQLVTADFNGDGKLDLAGITNGFAILLGNGDGTFQSPVLYGEGPKSYYSIAAADLNGDGTVDIIAGEQVLNFVSVSLGNGDGTFRTRQIFPAPGVGPCCVVAGDFNGDGLLDLAQNFTLDDSVTLFPQVTSVLSSTHVNFGNVKVGSSTTRKFTLTNIGSTSFTINQIKIIAKQRQYWNQKNDCGSTLASGASCTFTLVFKPMAAGHDKANLSISDSAVNALQVVALQGVGTK